MPSAADDLKEAIRHIQSLIDGEYCPWGAQRQRGESCAEYRSRVQGVKCGGCAQCEARAFLKRMGVSP